MFQKPNSLPGSKQSSHHSRGTHADSRTDSRGGAPQHLSLHVLIHCSVVRCCFRMDQILGACTCSRSSEFSNFCARVSNLWVPSVQTCRRAQVIRDFVSFAILSFVRDDLWSSGVQTRRRAQVGRDFVSFTIIVLVCDNLWSSSVQTCRRAQVIELQLH